MVHVAVYEETLAAFYRMMENVHLGTVAKVLLGLLLVSFAEGGRRRYLRATLAKKQRAAEAVAKAKAFELIHPLANMLNSIFVTQRGRIASMRDGRAIAEVEGKFRLFPSLESYRETYKDDDAWAEITDISDMRKFIDDAAGVLQLAR